MNDFRLVKDVRPSRYALRLELDLDRWTSNGKARIALRTVRPLRELTLHAVGLDIGTTTLDGAAASRIAYDEDSQTASFTFPREIAAGAHELALEWAGEIREALRGLYRSTRGDERYAATQFEEADARRAFPCFDEPEFKATWALTLVHREGLVAIANGAIVRAERLGDGRVATTFGETPKFSSYLVAFTVGPYESTPVAHTASGVPVRVWVPQGLVAQAVYARDAHVRALQYLEEYTGIPYPYGKVDAIGLPDFASGAMENPGAITYRVRLLAADHTTASIAVLKQVFSVAAHELTHMWWGDLVTMAWWNDIWLNESFANFVGEKATSALNPEWHYERDVVADNSLAFTLDSLAATHAISMDVKNADEASQRFDDITYLKGQGVLRMIESFLGADAFRDGVRIYLNRHREANATADDFWRALDEASGRDVTGLANAWIGEPGHPLVECGVRERGDGLGVTLRQQRFFADPKAPTTAQRWPIPLVVRYGTDGGVADERTLLSEERGAVDLAGARWYYPNGGATGFYRTALDDRSIALLAPALPHLRPEERYALLDNEWALARADRKPLAHVFALIDGLRDEDDRLVLQLLATIFGYVSTHVARPATDAPFRQVVDRLYRRQLEKLGWDVRSDDTADERERRSLAIGTLAQVATADDVRREARRRVDAHLAGTARLVPDVAGAIIGAAAASGDMALYERYVARMKQVGASDAQEEARLRSALAAFQDPAVVERAARDVFTDLIRSQDKSLLLLQLLGDRRAREIVWRRVKAVWDEEVPKMDPHGRQRTVSAVSQLSPRPLATEAIAFLQARQSGDITETVAQGIERLRLLADNAERMAGELGAALERISLPA